MSRPAVVLALTPFLGGAALAARPPAIVVGDVVILPADETMVSADGNGGWAIKYDEARDDPPNISQAFYLEFPADDFDFLSVFTAFEETGTLSPALAWSVRNKVAGLGLIPYDVGKRFGSPARLKTWISMRQSAAELSDPKSWLWEVWAQEVGHLHLAHLRFADGNGRSTDMLGRDGAHWSALLQADASVMDGNQWRDNGNGTFTKVAEKVRFSPLDQYALGLRDADDVPPFFLLRSARLGSDLLEPTSYVSPGAVVTAFRHDITIDDVTLASGIRLPQAFEAPRDHRMAVIILTAPGQDPQSARTLAEGLGRVLPSWERRFRGYVDGRGTMCTSLRSECPKPLVRMDDAAIRESSGDGVLDPGEEATVQGTAAFLGEATMSVEGGGLFRRGTMKAASTDPAPTAFEVPILVGAVPCGDVLRLNVRAEVDGLAALRTIRQPVGVRRIYADGFESDSGWHRLEAAGPAGEGAWERGRPESRTAIGLRVNPDRAFEGENVWATGLTAGAGAGANDVDRTETLESPAIPADGFTHVMVRYQIWWNSVTIENDFPFPGADVFAVSASWDGGPFVGIDRIPRARALTNTWVERAAHVAGTGRALTLRFTAEDPYPDTPVEAALDAVEVWGRDTGDCPTPTAPPEPDGGTDGPEPRGSDGCGCRLGGHSQGGGAVLLLGVLASRRRRAA